METETAAAAKEGDNLKAKLINWKLFSSDELERGVENKITRGGWDWTQYRDQDNNCKSLAVNSSPSVDTVI